MTSPNSDKMSIHSKSSSISSLSQNSMRDNPQPRYLRDPTTLETISSAFTGISSYMMKNTLIGKAFQKNTSALSSFNSILSTSPNQNHDKSVHKVRPKAKVTCAEFDTLEFGNGETRSYILLGYNDGFQVWDIDDIGNIRELALVKFDIGSVNCLKLISSDDNNPLKLNILIGAVRTLPLVPNAEEDDFNQIPNEISVVCLYSLYENKIISKTVYEKERITSLLANKLCIAIGTSLPCIRLLSRRNLTEFHCFKDVLITPSSRAPVFTLGPRWIAYSTTLETPWKADFKVNSSIPGNNGKVDRVAKDMVNGLKYIGDFGYQRLNNYLKSNNESNAESSSPRRNSSSININVRIDASTGSSFSPEEKGYLKDSGRVIIRDIMDFIIDDCEYLLSPKLDLNTNKTSGSIAHFQCHYYPIACLAFNKTGNLLATSSVEGHTFYVFEIVGYNHLQPPFRLLYKLSRGFTDAKVISMVFNEDSRWLATTTHHGTTHLFQINPYGGPPHFESHIQGRVLNPADSTRTNKYSYHDNPKPFSLVPAVRFRRKKGTETTEAEDDDFIESPQLSIRINEELHYSTMFPIPTANLVNWLNRLPPAYEQPNTENELKSSLIMLNIDLEGSLMLTRMTVSSKSNNVELNDEREEELVTTIERIAEWNLAKNPSDIEKYYDPVFIEPSPRIEASSRSEPESSWLPFVETKSYNPYNSLNRPLWLLNQFDFNIYLDGTSASNDTPGLVMFNKEKCETEIVNIKKQILSRSSAKDKVTYQPSTSFGAIEDHLVNAMQTDLEKPPVTTAIPIKKDPISFEDALEIHMVENLSSNRTRFNSSRKTFTEIPPNFAEDLLSSDNQSYKQQALNEDNFDHVGVFEMEYDDPDQFINESASIKVNENLSYSQNSRHSFEEQQNGSPPTLPVKAPLNDVDDCEELIYDSSKSSAYGAGDFFDI